VKYLIDVNVLVAWGWVDHTEHHRVAKWIATTKKSRTDTLLTSAIPQLGFIRVSVQRAGGRLTAEDAGQALEKMLQSLGPVHAFLPDDEPSFVWPQWCRGAARTTDAHLSALAVAHGAQLVTLDKGMPGAWVI
jgi:toxin-antitoxin system PIN domain toxin